MSAIAEPNAVSVATGRFTPLQRLLHWLMAIGILSMLFIGVGMVSTVSQAHLTLVSIHKPLGIALLLLVILRVGVRLSRGAPALPAAASRWRSWSRTSRSGT